MFRHFLITLSVFLTISVLSVTVFAADLYPVKVCGSGRHTLILLSDGTVHGWGAVDAGDLGPLSAIKLETKHAAEIVSIKLPRKAVDIAAADESSFAVLEDGTVFGWGKMQRSETPVKLPNLSDIVKISAGGDSGLALNRNGGVYGFSGGKYNYQLIPNLQNITEISTAGFYSAALDASGNVWTWGNNERAAERGVLGRENEPLKVKQVSGLTNVVSISAQPAVMTVVKNDGSVWVWGSNHSAQLANGKKSDSPNRGKSSEIVFKPRRVAGIENAVSIAAGNGAHTIVLLKDRTLLSWGNSQLGQTGSGTSGEYLKNPVAPKIFGIKSVFVIGMNSFAIKTDNTIWMWGANTSQGFPYNETRTMPEPLRLDGILKNTGNLKKFCRNSEC